MFRGPYVDVRLPFRKATSTQRLPLEIALRAVTDPGQPIFWCITTHYGSGRDPETGLSITHLEIRRAIELKKPRWLLAHENVPFAWSLLKNLRYRGQAIPRQDLQVKKTALMDDLRVLDLYEEAIVNALPLPERQGNWVQRFRSTQDGLTFVTAQFSRYQEVEQFLRENFEERLPTDEGN